VTRSPLPQTVALRDQILAILRESTAPRSTQEVQIELTAKGMNCNSRTMWWPSGCEWWAEYPQTGCSGSCWGSSAGGGIYPQLRALCKLGLVEHIAADADSRAARWRYLDQPEGLFAGGNATILRFDPLLDT
jgi:hypothetical protein